MSKSEEKLKVTVNTYSDHKGSVTNVNEARDINTYSTYISNSNVLPKGEQRPICFRYRPPVDDFVGREKELIFVKEHLLTANPRIVAVSGLGGIGKTQLVKKFVEQNRNYYRNIIWINSQREEFIKEEFKILAASALDISLNVDGTERDFHCIIGMIFDKLSIAKTLLVFDNIDKTDTLKIILDIFAAVDVKPHILLTSRNEAFSDSVISRKVEVLSLEEAVDYITAKLSNESLADKMELADTLKNLPLALRQATAHIRHHVKSDGEYNIRSYIADFNRYREKTLSSDLFHEDCFNQYEDTTLNTWKITMDAIRKCASHGELALRILHIMAYFDNVHIVREIFFNLGGLSNEPEREVMSAVRLICNYSMVDEYEHQSVLSIHKLVQEVIQIQLENEQRSKSTLRDGLQLILHMKEKGKFGVCIAHGISVYRSAIRFRELVVDFDNYPLMILRNLVECGGYLRAFSFANEINEQFARMLGLNHRSTIRFQFEIANLYITLGKYSEALQMYKEVLEKTPVEDHLETITIKLNIAHSYSNLGKCSEALQMYEEVLEKVKIVLGDDHPHTIATKHNIGHSYSNLGRYQEALKMLEEVREREKTILGDNHPDSITTKHNIAQLYVDLGRYSEALQMYEEVLAERNRIQGGDHPNTITTKHNMAHLYSHLGRYSEALQMYEEVLEKQKIILGDDHPDTVLTKHNIAQLYYDLGKYSEALRMCEEVLEKQIIILGADHPRALITKHNIAHSYSNLGQHSVALQMYEEVLEKNKIILGEDHPSTIAASQTIADLYINLGRYAEALQMHEEVLAKRNRIQGEDHPDTIFTNHNIGRLYFKMGEQSKALQMCAEVLEKRKKILGEDHPDTVDSNEDIAKMYRDLGRYEEALQMHEEVLAKKKKILGEDHPDTVDSNEDIAKMYRDLGRYEEALRMYEEVLERHKMILGEGHHRTIATKSIIVGLRKRLGTGIGASKYQCLYIGLFAVVCVYIFRFWTIRK